MLTLLTVEVALMSNNVQPGVKIDESVWKDFRENIKARKGGVRGHLRTELETAIRLYINGEHDETAEQINARLSRIESELGVAEADGGAHTSNADPHTHTPTPAPDEKPDPQAPTDKKVRWLAERFKEDHGDKKQIPKADFKDVVKDAYGFRADTAKRYVEALIDHFEYVTHPSNDVIYMTQDEQDRIIEQRREKAEQDAKDEIKAANEEADP